MGVAERLHNPLGRLCGCPPECVCQRSALGRAFRWYIPGPFHTPMLTAMPEPVQASLAACAAFPRRFGRPEEYAALVGHVVSNPMLNGEVIRLDGAARMPPR